MRQPATHEVKCILQQKSDKTFFTGADKRIYNENPLSQWVWRANQGACIDCTARDGRKYFYPDALKLKWPHPNCKCTLEVLEASLSNPGQLSTVRVESAKKANKNEDPYPGEVLKDLYGPKETDHWHTTPMEFFFNIESAFLSKGLRDRVRRNLKQKSRDFAYCPRWSSQFRIHADNYSIWDAFIDGYYYGSDAHQEVTQRIEKEVTSGDCHILNY